MNEGKERVNAQAFPAVVKDFCFLLPFFALSFNLKLNVFFSSLQQPPLSLAFLVSSNFTEDEANRKVEEEKRARQKKRRRREGPCGRLASCFSFLGSGLSLGYFCPFSLGPRLSARGSELKRPLPKRAPSPTAAGVYLSSVIEAQARRRAKLGARVGPKES